MDRRVKRSQIKRKRSQPRRRAAPRFDREQWDEATMLLFARARGRCEIGGEQLGRDHVERHHRQRRRDGGDRLSNLLLVCTDHHRHVTEHPVDARRSGFVVTALSRIDPADVPVQQWGDTWVLLSDTGTTSRCHDPETRLLS
jgi:hypothetical protein